MERVVRGGKETDSSSCLSSSAAVLVRSEKRLRTEYFDIQARLGFASRHDSQAQLKGRNCRSSFQTTLNFQTSWMLLGKRRKLKVSLSRRLCDCWESRLECLAGCHVELAEDSTCFRSHPFYSAAFGV